MVILRGLPGDNCIRRVLGFFQVSIRYTLGLALLCLSVRDVGCVADLYLFNRDIGNGIPPCLSLSG